MLGAFEQHEFAQHDCREDGDARVLAVGSTEKATGQAIAALDRLLSSKEARDSQRAELQVLAERYALPGASDRAARSILTHLVSGGSGIEMNRLQRSA